MVVVAVYEVVVDVKVVVIQYMANLPCLSDSASPSPELRFS